MAAAQDTATLAVTVLDPSDSLVPSARLVLIHNQRGSVHQCVTNDTGFCIFAGLTPGEFTVEAEREGFDKFRVSRIALTVRERQTLRIRLSVKASASTVTVVSEAEGINTDASRGVSLDQEYLRHLPANGRNAETLILMAPGVNSASGGRGGTGFHANGLRSNTNYFTLDGVSVNSEIQGPAGAGGRGPGPGAMSGGSSNPSTELINLDAMQEMRVQTSAFAPEFGRSPGAQVTMASRGGTNAYHGLIYYYFRHDRLSANDWFSNASGLARGKLRQARPGGTFGGPLRRNRTFFFAAYEKLLLTAPATVVSSVPDLASRQSAATRLRPYLNAFPLPNAENLGGGAAQFRAQVSNPSESDSASLRLDHGLTARSTLFVRYAWAPSSSTGRASDLMSPNVVSRRDSQSHVFTSGISTVVSVQTVNDLRVNYSLTKSRNSQTMDDFGGAVPLSTEILPVQVRDSGKFNLTVLGLSGYGFGRSGQDQFQINVVDTLTRIVGAHNYKFGVDYRRIGLTMLDAAYQQSVVFDGLSGDSGALLSGSATNAQVRSNLESVYPVFTNFSLFGQDTWRATERTTLTYGLRWDVNPPPGVRDGPPPFARASSFVAGVTQNEPLYQTRWFNVAPRIGLAYVMDTASGREMVLRMGAGIFYDLGYGTVSSTFNGAPYANVRTISSAAFPLTASDATPPVMPPTRPYGQVSTADPNLLAPVVTQWNATVERYFGQAQLLSIGYAGTRGRRLMRVETQPSFGDAYDILMLTTNGATSDYHGLQVQFRRRLSVNLQTQLSYAYSHAIDSSSNDAGFGGGFATLFGGGQRSSSDYDVRHNLNFSGTYSLPAPRDGWAAAIVRHWHLDWIATARTGLPLDVQGVSAEADSDAGSTRPGGLFAQVRPNYNGLPPWLDDLNAPGGQRLNPDAFTLPSGFGQGSLGRNALRGFGAAQLDLSLRRQFRFGERATFDLAGQAFNVFNRANFANPSPLEGANLSSPNFGLATRMLNQSFGGTSPVFRSGGPRSVEISARFQF